MTLTDKPLSQSPPASPTPLSQPEPGNAYPFRRSSTWQSGRFGGSEHRDFAFSPRQLTGFSDASSIIEPHWERQCVLSLDGGGIRGYSSLLILRDVMQRVAQKEQEADEKAESSFQPAPLPNDTVSNGSDDNKGKYLPCHYFDYIGGTSTGGLISIMLGRLRMSVDDCIKEYEQFGGEVFGHPRLLSIRGPIPWLRDKYCGDRLKQVVDDVVERRLPSEQLQVGAGNFNSAKGLCKTVVVAYEQKRSSSHGKHDRGDSAVSNRGPYLFRSYDHWGSKQGDTVERNPGSAHSIPIWQVARATTSAPTYFHPIEIQGCKFGDGGFGTNNPVKELYYEVSQMQGNDASNISLLLSIGTGQSEISRFSTGPLAKYYAYIKAAKKLASDSEEAHSDMLRVASHRRGPDFYYRLNVPITTGLGEMKLDDWKPQGELQLHKFRRRTQNDTLRTIEDVTLRYCQDESTQKQLDTIAQTLFEHRRARCRDARLWELFSSGIQFRCTEKHCRKSQKLHTCRASLKGHLLRAHFYDGSNMSKLDEVIELGKCHI